MREGIVELREEHRRGAYEVVGRRGAGHGHRRAGGGAPLRRLGEAGARRTQPSPSSPLEDGRVAGYATLQTLGEQPNRLEHGFTGVRPEYRRRGIATALGDAQLAWAAERGFEELITTTGVTNAALRAQKAKLGY